MSRELPRPVEGVEKQILRGRRVLSVTLQFIVNAIGAHLGYYTTALKRPVEEGLTGAASSW